MFELTILFTLISIFITNYFMNKITSKAEINIPLLTDFSLIKGGRRCNNPGGTFYDGCNTCGCSPEGYVTFCTLRACIDGPIPQG